MKAIDTNKTNEYSQVPQATFSNCEKVERRTLGTQSVKL